MHRKKRFRLSGFSIFNTLFFLLLGLCMVFPLWNVLVISLTEYQEYVRNPLLLWPENVTFSAYKYIFSTGELLDSLYVTVFITLVGTAFSMVITTAAAYALSKKSLPGRGAVLLLILFTMLFNGGLVPNFLLIRSLGLYNSLWVLILPNALNAWYLIIMKNYFTALPPALEESARIDGAGSLRILLRVVLPISMPIIATFVLFYAVDRWNEWWSAMMYIGDTSKYPLQLVLRNLIVKNFASAQMASSYSSSGDAFVAKENIKMATAIVATVPILVVYPFLQKYFAKGIMVGAVKS